MKLKISVPKHACPKSLLDLDKKKCKFLRLFLIYQSDSNEDISINSNDESNIIINSPENDFGKIATHSQIEPKKSPTNDTVSVDLSRLENSKLFKKFVAEEEYKKIIKPLKAISQNNFTQENQPSPILSPERNNSLSKSKNNSDSAAKNVSPHQDHNQKISGISGFEETLGPEKPKNSFPSQQISPMPFIPENPKSIDPVYGMLELAIRKNQELEKAVTSQTEKSTKVIENLRNKTEDEFQNYQKKLDAEIALKNEWKDKFEKLDLEYKKAKLIWEQSKIDTIEYTKKYEMTESNCKNLSELEESQRKCLTQLTSKIIANESEIRQKDERIFSLQNEVQQLKIEYNIQKDVLEQLKSDYTTVFQKRTNNEAELSQLKTKLFNSETLSRKAQQNCENFESENKTLREQKIALENTLEEIKNENTELNKIIARLEKSNADLLAQNEKIKRDYQSLEISYFKLQANSDTIEKSLIMIKEDYEKLVEQNKQILGGNKNKINIPQINGISKLNIIENNSLTSRTNNISDFPSAKYNENKYKQNQSTNLTNLLKWDTSEQGNKLTTSFEQQNPTAQPKIAEKPISESAKPISTQKVTNSLQDSTNFDLQSKSENIIKPVVVTFPSNKKYEENKDLIFKMQSNLQQLQTEKQQLEKEYAKFGQKSQSSIAQKKRKEELEFELDLTDKNIQRIKQKLREFKAF